MALLQALISFITRSAGKAVNAVFGWAVLALFGATSPQEQTVLSAVVAAAAAWPLLAVGAIFPKAALFVVSFVPLAKSVPSLWLRIVWIALALLVPFVVGAAIAARAPEEAAPESGLLRVLRGFQVTLALAAAFLLMMIVTPILRIASAAKRRKIVHVPAVMDKRDAPGAMEALAGQLRLHGHEIHHAPPPWHLTAPSKLLLRVGGRPFRRMAAEDPEYRRGQELAVAVLPNETLLEGTPRALARAQALVSEVYGPRPVLQTFDAQAQDLERHVKRVWSVLREQPRRHQGASPLRSRVDELARELARADSLPWDEWQLVYRLLLQLDRALRGDDPLLSHPRPQLKEAMPMPTDKEKLALPAPGELAQAAPSTPEPLLASLSNRELLTHAVQSATLLAKKELELAKTELKADLRREAAMAKGLGAAGLCAIFTVNLMLVACALALGHVMPEWAAALVVAAAVLAVGTVAGFVGWGKRVQTPLQATRRSVKEDVTWAKERLA